jgi:hypothetical protein
MRTKHGQRGWVGLIVLLIALLIVALLSQKLLKQMGLFSSDRAISNAAGPRGPGPAAEAPVDATGASITPGNAIERARGLESSVQQQAQDLNQRLDAQTK